MPGLIVPFILFTALYLVLGVVVIVVIMSIARETGPRAGDARAATIPGADA